MGRLLGGGGGAKGMLPPAPFKLLGGGGCPSSYAYEFSVLFGKENDKDDI